MGWVIWVIVLIPVAVSILSLLFKPTKEEPRRGPRMRPGPQQGPPRPARRSVSDIDQFLEEINRRRREAAERRQGQEPFAVPPAPPEVKPVPPPLPVPPPVVRQVRRLPRERPVPTRSRQRPLEPETIVVAEVALAPPPLARLPLDERRVEVIAETIAVPASPAKHVSPTLAQLMPLLRSPQGLRTALLVREILGAPLARRRRQGRKF